MKEFSCFLLFLVFMTLQNTFAQTQLLVVSDSFISFTVTPQNFLQLVLLVCFSHSALHPVHICDTESKQKKKADCVLYMSSERLTNANPCQLNYSLIVMQVQ